MLRRTSSSVSTGFDVNTETQFEWLRRVLHSLEAMKKQLDNTPWSFRRSETLKKLLKQKWSEIGTLENALFHAAAISKDNQRLIRPVYSAGNLSEIILEKLQDPKLIKEQVYLFAPVPGNLLCIKYMMSFEDKELAPIYKKTDFRNSKNTLSRADTWLKQLEINREIELYEKKRYARLQQHVIEHQLFTDLLIFKDIKMTSVDDDYYFVFEDFLHQILLVFSRDPEIFKVYEKLNLKSLQFLKDNSEETLPYPPNGVIPYHGFSLLLAPLCYVFDQQELLYLVFKKIYSKFWVNLHNIHVSSKSTSEGIIKLCINVEQRLLKRVPVLCQHLGRLDIALSRLIFPWLFTAFSGLLPPGELLVLWDFVMKRESLLPLADLAVGIILWRESTLLSCDENHSIEAALKDLSTIKVEPLFLYYFSK